jgi:hypothetical protein
MIWFPAASIVKRNRANKKKQGPRKGKEKKEKKKQKVLITVPYIEQP